MIDEADLFEGTVDEAAIHPREVVKAALDRPGLVVDASVEWLLEKTRKPVL